MGYNHAPYEDELDRMRARQQSRKYGTSNRRDNFQGWDDTIVYKPEHSYDSSSAREDFESFDLDEDWDQDTNLNFETFELEEEEEMRPRKQNARAAHPVRRPSAQQHRAPAGNARVGSASGKAKKGGKKRFRKGRFLFRILCLIALIAAGSFLFQWFRSDTSWTIAVFGVDSRDGNVGRGALSDVEMLCNINQKTGEIRLISVFRDSYLRIDQEEDYDKINEAYFLGGHKQAVSALEDNLDLQIDDYATFNWKAVVDAINVLGGVDIEITDKEFGYINSFITETVESTGVGSHHLESSGMNHLDGVQAVAYARLRLMDTDFNRTERQRKVLGLAMEKAKSADIGTLTTLVRTVYPQISTSIGIDDLIGTAKNAKKYYISQTSGFPFSHQEIKISKKSCVVPTTLESNVIQLHSFLYDTEQYTPSDRVKRISNHIIEVSGLGEPGKDTESGKNVGAEGSSGGGQSGSSTQATQPPQTEAQTETPEETSLAEPESADAETEPETVEGETIEAIEPIEPEETENESESPIIGPGNDQNTEQGPSVGPGFVEQKETNASLEAPGQGNPDSETEQGPGAV